ncbi:hypothetical protein BGX26_009432 [Mortierella sp. AD094]|nr:hypothetical protein BGX26_009432 [Mortierella sp. AD094]
MVPKDICTYDNCIKYDFKKTFLNQTEKDHWKACHRISFQTEYNNVQFHFNRDPSKNMAFSCPCGAGLASTASLRTHLKGTSATSKKRRRPCPVFRKLAKRVLKSGRPLHENDDNNGSSSSSSNSDWRSEHTINARPLYGTNSIEDDSDEYNEDSMETPNEINSEDTLNEIDSDEIPNVDNVNGWFFTPQVIQEMLRRQQEQEERLESMRLQHQQQLQQQQRLHRQEVEQLKDEVQSLRLQQRKVYNNQGAQHGE